MKYTIPQPSYQPVNVGDLVALSESIENHLETGMPILKALLLGLTDQDFVVCRNK